MYKLRVKYGSVFSLLLSVCFCQSLVLATNVEQNIQTTFSCVSWDKPIKGTVYVSSDGEMIPLRVHNMRRSKLIDYHGPNPIVFYQKGQGEEGREAYHPIAQVQLDANIKQALLFFVGKEDNYKIMTLEDSFDAYPTGSYRFYNFTERDLLARLGDFTLQLPPKETAYLERPFPDSVEYPVAFVVRDSDGIRPLYTNMWTHIGRFRYLIFVSNSDSRDTGSMSFRILSDYDTSM